MGRFNVLQELLMNPQLYTLEELRTTNLLMALAVAAFCGFIIFTVYRAFNRGALYSENFNVLIVVVCVVTTFIIITIGTNLVLSLGMVGALSIVRFRAAVKDPLDVGFLFWGVAAGLTAGAQLHMVALIGTAFIAVLYILFSITRFEKRNFLLILRYGDDAEESVNLQLSKIKNKLKNKTMNTGYTEITVEVKVSKGDTSFVEPLRKIPNVDSVVLVEFTGDYA